MRAVCDVFPKLVSSDNTFNPEANFSLAIPDFDKIRNEAIIKLFKKLNLTIGVEAVNNVVNGCIEILENRSILEFVTSEREILDHIFGILSINLNAPENSELSSYNYKEILILLLNILKDSIIDNISIPGTKKSEIAATDSSEEAQESQNPQNNDEGVLKDSLVGELIIQNLSKILDNFQISDTATNQLDATFNMSIRIIGITR